MKTILKKMIPGPLKPVAGALYRRVHYYLQDRKEIRSGERSTMTPPLRKLYNTDVAEFEKVGRDFFNYFLDLGKIKPDDYILDVGCGQGRMAAPLTKYLSEKGRYVVFDIRRQDIEWCQKKITPKHSNFRFQTADVFNKAYNPPCVFTPYSTCPLPPPENRLQIEVNAGELMYK